MQQSFDALDEAMEVHAIEGEVVVIGPDGVAVSLTPAAAAESGKRLQEAANAIQLEQRGARTIGWTLHPDDREALLGQFAPAYPKVAADHVTLQHKAPLEAALPPAKTAEVRGIADDGAGVQALVVAIDGGVSRPDGSVYHITWSLAPGRTAKESNAVIAQDGWRAVDCAVQVRLNPAAFD